MCDTCASEAQGRKLVWVRGGVRLTVGCVLQRMHGGVRRRAQHASGTEHKCENGPARRMECERGVFPFFKMLLLELLQVVAPTMYSAVMCSVMHWGRGTTERHDEDNRVSERWWGRGSAGDGDAAALAHDCKRVIGSQTSEGKRGVEGQGGGDACIREYARNV